MSKIKGVSLDFDNVLYNLELAENKFILDVYGHTIKSSDVISWDFYPKTYPRIFDVWNLWEYYSKGQIFPEAIDFVNELRNITNVRIITTTASKEIEINKDKMIASTFGDIEVVHTKDKTPFTVDTILVDDYHMNIKNHIENNDCPAILFDLDYGWLKDFDEKQYHLVSRVSSHNEALLKIKEYF